MSENQRPGAPGKQKNKPTNQRSLTAAEQRRLSTGTSDAQPYLPKPQRRAIKLDRISPADLRIMNPQFFCDDCSHYSPSQNRCTMGYRAQHTRAEQMALYNLTGKMALCRFLEID
jgi:hypothetical protein